MNTKVLLIILDGAGDRPIKELNYKTPLEAAYTPFLDNLAEQSQCGMMNSIGFYQKPSSDVAHMAIFGVDLKYYPGRGPIEAAGLGIQCKDDDLFFRGNFCHLNENGVITDRRAERKKPSKKLLADIKTIIIDDVNFDVFHIAEHRFVLRLQGKGLSSKVSNSDPHSVGTTPKEVFSLDGEQNSLYTANLLNKYIEIIGNKLNKIQEEPINHILIRSPGFIPKWPSFYEKHGFISSCITNNSLYNGIGALLKMKVILPNRFENYELYYKSIPGLLQKALTSSDFVFLHFQETDLFGENGDWKMKTKAIEQIDETLSSIKSLLNEACVIVTSDHSTPCSLYGHSGDEVPFMIHYKGARFDNVKEFNEKSCSFGSLGHFEGCFVMPMIQNILNNNELIGG